MSVSYDIRNLKTKADADRKRADFFRLLKLQQKLNADYENAMMERSSNEQLGITPVKPKEKSVSEEKADETAQMQIADRNLRTIMKVDEAQKVLSKLNPTDIFNLNSVFKALETKLAGETNITADYFVQVFRRYIQARENPDLTNRELADEIERIASGQMGTDPLTGLPYTMAEAVQQLSDEYVVSSADIINQLRSMKSTAQRGAMPEGFERTRSGLIDASADVLRAQGPGVLKLWYREFNKETLQRLAGLLTIAVSARDTKPVLLEKITEALKDAPVPEGFEEPEPESGRVIEAKERMEKRQEIKRRLDALKKKTKDKPLQNALQRLKENITEEREARRELDEQRRMGLEEQIQRNLDVIRKRDEEMGRQVDVLLGDIFAPFRTYTVPTSPQSVISQIPSPTESLLFETPPQSPASTEPSPRTSGRQQGLVYATDIISSGGPPPPSGRSLIRDEQEIMNMNEDELENKRDFVITLHDSLMDAVDQGDFEPSKFRPWGDYLQRLYNRIVERAEQLERGMVAISMEGTEETKGRGLYRYGSGFIKKPRYGRRIVGRGIEKQPETYKKFGRYLIYLPALKKGIFHLKFPCFTNCISIPKREISIDLKEFIEDMLENGTINKRLYEKLNPEDRRYFNSVAEKARIDAQVGISENVMKQNREDMKRFELVKGIVQAGNNSPEVLEELANWLMKFSHEGKLNKNQVQEILIDLIAVK